LRVTDSDGYSCRASNDDLGKPLLIQFALPKWKEVISW